jgi:voltage-gated potassium channel
MALAMTARIYPDGELPADQAATSAAYRLFMLLVALNALVVALLYYVSFVVPAIPPAVRQVLYFADTINALLFLFDFGLQMKRAPNRRHYFLHWGWLDFITAIPGAPLLRLLRVVRVAQVTRTEIRNTPAEVRLAARQRLAQSTFLLVIALVLLIVIYGSVAIVLVEANAPSANITSGGDAVWWAFVTIATVGYGDTYPVTGWGRVIGVAMLVAGVSLFSVLTSFLASTFLKPAEHGDEIRDRILHAQLAELKQAVRDLEARLVERDSRQSPS